MRLLVLHKEISPINLILTDPFRRANFAVLVSALTSRNRSPNAVVKRGERQVATLAFLGCERVRLRLTGRLFGRELDRCRDDAEGVTDRSPESRGARDRLLVRDGDFSAIATDVSASCQQLVQCVLYKLCLPRYLSAYDACGNVSIRV